MNKEVLFTEEPIFETERIILRRLDIDDLEEYYRFASDPLVSERTLWNRHESTEDTRVFLENVQKSYIEKIAYRWAVIYKPERRYIAVQKSDMQMKKVGMKEEGILREKFQIKGEFVDQIQFAMIRKDAQEEIRKF